MTTHGMFAWNELVTEDTEAARDFYQKLLGWDSFDIEMPEGAYTVFQADDTEAAGMLGMHGVEWGDSTPHWMGHIAVDDVDACSERVEQGGGTVEIPPTDAPDVGRFSVITDPDGAAVALVTFEEPDKFDYSSDHGRFCWNELYTPAPETAQEFYGDVIGWDFRTWQDENYILAMTDEGEAAGMMDTSTPEWEGHAPPPHWASYVAVDDVDASAEQAIELGGQVLHGPADIPEMGRFAVVQDPAGAVIYLITFAEE